MLLTKRFYLCILSVTLKKGYIMTSNVGKIDKILRIVLGLAIIAYGVIEESWLGVIGIIPLATGLINWCPVYYPFGINTTCDKGNCSKK
jgi:hypothetical protein